MHFLPSVTNDDDSGERADKLKAGLVDLPLRPPSLTAPPLTAATAVPPTPSAISPVRCIDDTDRAANNTRNTSTHASPTRSKDWISARCRESTSSSVLSDPFSFPFSSEVAREMHAPTTSAADIPHNDDDGVEEEEEALVSICRGRVTNLNDRSSSLSMLNNTTASIDACNSRRRGCTDALLYGLYEYTVCVRQEQIRCKTVYLRSGRIWSFIYGIGQNKIA